MRHRVVVGVAVALAAAVVGARAPSWAGSGKDDKKKGPHLRYAAVYADAVAEVKARNTLVYAIFHKDH
jgi:hypothetical protein